MEKQHIPGVSIVVIKDQKIVKSAGYGLANVELNVAATPETVFRRKAFGLRHFDRYWSV
jgi:D-alanyl-D-alanine carboxypeptidase